MKAITLWQPWAQLIAIGEKRYETRSWETKYRGMIAIHAAKKKPPQQGDLESDVFSSMTNAFAKHYGAWRFDWHLGGTRMNSDGSDNGFDIPLGCIIATAELVNCWRIVYHPGTNVDIAKNIPIGAELDVPRKHPDFGRYIVPTEKEMLFGDWTPGRYAWELTNVKLLPNPIPAKGSQRLWDWEELR